MNETELIVAIGRITEGAGLSLGNRHNRAELEANLTFIKANVRHALELIGSSEAE